MLNDHVPAATEDISIHREQKKQDEERLVYRIESKSRRRREENEPETVRAGIAAEIYWKKKRL